MATILGFAVVDAGGAVLHGSGVQRVTHIGTGQWNLYFDFSVANACEVATLAEKKSAAGWISAYGEPGIDANEVTVQTGVFTWEFLEEALEHTYGRVVPVTADLTFQLAVFG